MTRHDEARDLVARYLADRGASDHVRKEGLRGMVARWKAIAHDAEYYDSGIEDWLNDIDLRDIIAGAVDIAPAAERLAIEPDLFGADATFRAATVETKRSLWGDAVSATDGHDSQRQWWYFRRPAHPGRAMRADLKRMGID